MHDSPADPIAPVADPGRRDFVRTTLGSGFAAAVLPVSAQTQIKTDSTGLVVGETTAQRGADKVAAAWVGHGRNGVGWRVVHVVSG